jgi:hypothetical protein
MVWQYRNKTFETKLERDTYAEGWMDAMAECEKRRKEYHIRED